ncbi:hypothetical protein I551_0434, partial [Mycobacterium ulcerans str. Harvey]
MNFRLYAGRRCTVDPAAPLSLPGYSALLAPEPPALPSARAHLGCRRRRWGAAATALAAAATTPVGSAVPGAFPTVAAVTTGATVATVAADAA